MQPDHSDVVFELLRDSLVVAVNSPGSRGATHPHGESKIEKVDLPPLGRPVRLHNTAPALVAGFSCAVESGA